MVARDPCMILGPSISRSHFFSPCFFFFFCVSFNGLSEQGTTRSLFYTASKLYKRTKKRKGTTMKGEKRVQEYNKNLHSFLFLYRRLWCLVKTPTQRASSIGQFRIVQQQKNRVEVQGNNQHFVLFKTKENANYSPEPRLFCSRTIRNWPIVQHSSYESRLIYNYRTLM